MKKGGSKRKGAAWERVVAERLSLWVTGGICNDIFWRSAMSGGRATLKLKKGEKSRVSGDICAVAPEGHPFTDYWFVENKHVRDLEMASFIIRSKGLLASFWKKAREQAAQHQRTPMLIARQNNYPIIVLIPYNPPWEGSILDPLASGPGWNMYDFNSLLKEKFKP